MLLVLAAVLQTLLLGECLLRRVLQLALPSRATPVQRYANASLVSTLVAVGMNLATLPAQALARLLSGLSRYVLLALCMATLFAVLLVVSPSSVFMYSVSARIYNLSVTPFLVLLRLVLILVDVLWRVGTPLFNGFVFFGSELLKRLVVPLSRDLAEEVGELLQLLVLALAAFARALLLWGERLWDCTGGFEARPRVCGLVDANASASANASALASDCGVVFAAEDSSCYASPAHLQLDLITPFLYVRAAARVLQHAVTARCQPLAVVLNLAIFPLTDHQLYVAVHSAVNLALHLVVGQPVLTLRRCKFVNGTAVGRAAKAVACTPDFEPAGALCAAALQGLGLALDAWLNFGALQLGAALGGRAPTCNGQSLDAAHAVQLRLEDVVLDAARAIEGRSAADLELLASRGGLPRSETLAQVRVVGLSARMIAVTDGLNVLYRSLYDGAVFAYGAFPFRVDVTAGLAAVAYGVHGVGEADPFGDDSTGLLGCRCVDAAAGIELLCATAPYVAHVEDDEAAFNATAAHRVRFPGLSLAGMTCRTTSVRVLPLRWPRARLARAGSHGQGVSSGGYSGYVRPALSQMGRDWRSFFVGDEDAVDSLRGHAGARRAARVGGVAAAIFVAPACGGDGDGRAALRCALVDDNCFPYCLGLVRGGLRSQNVSMFNAKRWAESVVLPNADCGLGRDRGAACAEGASVLPLVDGLGALRAARCPAACAPSAEVSSVLPLDGNGTLGRVAAHNLVFGAVRLAAQPLVVAGDVMLAVARDAAGEERLAVVRLYDVGQGTMQMAAERLVSVAHAHAPRLAACATEADARCVAEAMLRGAVVLPPQFVQVGRAGVQAEGLVLPAASSRWAVHFAANPELDVYQAFFDTCHGGAATTGLEVGSSYGRARVWTVQTMRAVDLEGAGAPSAAEEASRVAYMRVPDFFDGARRSCDAIVGLRVAGVEYLNPENVLVTVLAGRPRDYDPLLGDLAGPRHYRYYFLHPQRHDCHEASEAPGRGFTCWRTEAEGQFPDDRVVSDVVGSNLCPEQRPLPAFGTALVLPLVATTAAFEAVFGSVWALAAAAATRPTNPGAGVLELLTLDAHALTFHGMVDSGGARLLDVEPFLAALRWLQSHAAGVMIYCVDVFLAATGLADAGNLGAKTAGGLRTLVVGTARVRQGMPVDVAPFAQVEALFRAPVEQASAQACTAVLTSTDGVAGYSLPDATRLFVRSQLALMAQGELVLRLARAMALRLIEASAARSWASLGGVVSASLVDARGVLESSFLDVMRSQCHGLALAGGWDGAIVQALFHACMTVPDTLEGCLSAFSVLVSEYPAADCVCKLGRDEALERACLAHETPAAQRAWMQDILFRTDAGARGSACFAAMDGANARLRSAFDKALRRIYLLALHAGQAADSALSMVTGDSEPCDAFEVSPYVMSIVPEPVDYFMHCSDTADCRTRCFEEFRAFEAANASLLARGGARPGIREEVALPVESMLFSVEDLADGRAAPPFEVQDAAELPASACAEVCGGAAAGNRCVVVAGVRRRGAGDAVPAAAYYCLPIDMQQYVRQWTPPGAAAYLLTGLAGELLLQVHVLSTWAAGAQSARFPSDALLAVLGDDTGSLYGRQGVRLVLVRAGMQARTLLRSRRGGEPAVQLEELGAEAVFREGWLSALERVRVTPAGAADGAVTVSVFGHRDYAFHENQLRQRRACLRGRFFLSRAGEAELDGMWEECETVPAAAFAEPREYEAAAGGAEWEEALDHASVCVRAASGGESSECALRLGVPRARAAGGGARLRVRSAAGDWSAEASAGLLRALQADRSDATYLDVDGGVHLRAARLAGVQHVPAEAVAAVLAGQAHTLALLLINGRDAGAWLQVLELALPGRGAEAAAAARARDSLRAETRVTVLMGCSVQNCAACGQTPERQRLPQLRELESSCYAAQTCAVARCAGTLVNLRKPLCNLGSVFAAEIHGARVVLQGCWHVITDSVGAVVEISQSRRRAFELAWPDEALRSLTCVGKDALVSACATFASILGAVSGVAMEVPVMQVAFLGATDARVHARYIMALASLTNFMAAVAMQPVYIMLGLQKIIACTLNDVSATLENFVENAKSVADGTSTGRYKKQLSLRLTFGSARVQEAIAEAGVATCFSEDVRQSVQDSVVAVGTRAAGAPPKLPAQVAALLSGFLDDAADSLTRAFVSAAYHVLDVFLAWLLGVIRGVQDVAQTLDWNNCKLPVIDDGLRSYGLCACGDEPYSIPAAERARTWADAAFWCSGFLMLNEADGSDLLVWNPYSLAELLAVPSAEAYMECLRGGAAQRAGCAALRPRLPALEQQGVEVLQVVARCRANYQNARWDEASVLYALYPRAAWAALHSSGLDAGDDDRWRAVRSAMARALRQAGPVRQGLLLDAETLACLEDALRGGALVHGCAPRAAGAFAYARAPAATFAAVDACRAFSGPAWSEGAAGALALGVPQTMWSGSSTTREPVTRLHALEQEPAEREAAALAELRAYVRDEIEPVFARMDDAELRRALEQHLDVTLWSVEGDALHQLVDCVVLGPYAAADLAHNVHDGGRRLPAPQYHRGAADSRAFAAWGETGGSPARRAFVGLAAAELAQAGVTVVVAQAWRHFEALRARWLGGGADVPPGLLCACERPGEHWERVAPGAQVPPAGAGLQAELRALWGDGPAAGLRAEQLAAAEGAARERVRFGARVASGGAQWQPASYRASLACCAAQAARGAEPFFAADAPFERREWDIGAPALAGGMAVLANSSVWERMLSGEGWAADEAFRAPARLQPGERARLREAGLFAPAHTQAVRAYDETEEALGGESLWAGCNARVAGLYATLPWARGEEDAARGTVQGAAEAAAALEAAHEGGGPARPRVHALEAAVDGMLERAHALSPGFYTHAHRYVPSDSVWCERGAAAAGAAAPDVRAAAAAAAEFDGDIPGLAADELRQVVGPGAGELLYPADALARCACGWSTDTACFVHPLACAAAPDAGLAEADRSAWAELCGGDQRYTTRATLVLVLAVLRRDAERAEAAPAWAAACDANVASTGWGLLDPENETAWYAGGGGPWAFDARRLATYGPGGLRLGLLAAAAPRAERLAAFAGRFNLGGDRRGTFAVPAAGAAHAHTVAQPVCRESLEAYLAQPLDAYFADVLLPMAHSVQLGAGAACGRWALEEALRAALARADAAPEQQALQAAAAVSWEARCVASAHGAGLCVTRGADLAGPGAAPAECPFAGHAVSGCARVFYTPGCLLSCDGAYYDPCLCEDAAACGGGPFAPGACARGRVGDARALAADPALLLSSLQWPARAESGEARSPADWEALRDALGELAARPAAHDRAALYARARAWLEAELAGELAGEAAAGEAAAGEAPPGAARAVHAYCDDLHDYWPDAQHPLGYHPTTACRRADTATRGFAAWMSRDEAGHALVDPLRLRNATRASEAFGAAHLVCDAHAYAAPGVELNPYYVRARWDAGAAADPAVPRAAPAVALQDMLTEGAPSFEPADSTLRRTQAPGDALLGHSVGLVRSWARWLGAAEGGRAQAQRALDDAWPHWVEDAGAHFLSGDGRRPAGCADPALLRCTEDSDCAGGFANASLVCLVNFAAPADERRGICARAGSCFQHQHCQDRDARTLCSGEGECVTPELSVVNELASEIGVQLFSPRCSADTRRLGRYEAVPDFARANGMCSFRDWYHYLNNTAAAAAAPGARVAEAPDRLFHRTDAYAAETLWRQGVLAHEAQPCDRSYQHTDFRACSARDFGAGAARALNATRTWALRDGQWHARFCVLPRHSSFLSPYEAERSAELGAVLKSAPREIQRCSRFRVCPSIAFAVRGRGVPRRRVRAFRDRETPEDFTRDYYSLDAARCGSFGQLVASPLGGPEENTECVVDHFVSPLVPAVFQRDAQTRNPVRNREESSGLLAELRKHCPYAFTEPVDNLRDEDLFFKMHDALTLPYSAKDTEARETVHRMANALVFAVFGVGTGTGARGLYGRKAAGTDANVAPDQPLDAYLRQGRCARHVAAKLQALESTFAGVQYRGFEYELADSKVSVFSSLYLFSAHVTVFVPLRWLMQCVVWAGSAEGGVDQGFVRRVLDGELVGDARGVSARCKNWRTSFETATGRAVQLRDRLLSAQDIFSVADAESGDLWDSLQMVRDVNAAVIWALNKLGVRDRPDLWCVACRDPAGNCPLFAPDSSKVVSLSARDVVRSNLPGLDAARVDAVDELPDSPLDMHGRVRRFLVSSSENFMQQTNAELVQSGKVKVRSRRLDDLVAGNAIRFPMYEFAKLDVGWSEAYLKEVEPKAAITNGEYVSSGPSRCAPARQLQSPEYELLGGALSSCDGLADPFLCETLDGIVAARASRFHQSPDDDFLRADELLFLVLHLVKRAMHDTVTGGSLDLHVPNVRQDSAWGAVLELFGDATANDPSEDALGLAHANNVELMMRTLSDSGVECVPDNEIDDLQQQTNQQHGELRDCLKELREEVGWVVPARQAGVGAPTLRLPVSAETLLEGFYPAFEELLPHTRAPGGSNEYSGEHFLSALFDGVPGETIPGEQICFSSEASDFAGSSLGVPDGKLVKLMNPFWGEFFDVAPIGGATEENVATGCDMKRSGSDNSLMVIWSLCPSTPDSEEGVCAQHPHYLSAVREYLPAACEKLHGSVVQRDTIGATRAPLCESRVRRTDAECAASRKHGLLHAKRGARAADLDAVSPVRPEHTQSGLWDARNSLFRANEYEAVALSAEATALKLLPTDIGGHRLDFHVSAAGVMRLARAPMASRPAAMAGDDVRDWLAHVEDDFVEQQQQYEFFELGRDGPGAGSSWRCPLHWLQRFVDDGSFEQARAPVAARNAVRFAHITGAARRYAHPTVRSSVRVPRLQPARFVSERLACVGRGAECHGSELLRASLEMLVQGQQQWATVRYVGNDTCDRVLDWPEEDVPSRP